MFNNNDYANTPYYMTRFFLIRHATTNAVGKHLSGRTAGVHLNEQGNTQAKILAERIRGLPIMAVYSSPLERAVETASPISKILNLNTVLSDDFLEIDFGEWTNHSFKELDDLQDFKNFNTFRSSTRIPGGELMAEAQLRIIKGLENLCGRHRDETVAIVSHADLIKAAVAYYAGVSLDLFQRFEISPASVSIIEIYDQTARIVTINNTGELRC